MRDENRFVKLSALCAVAVLLISSGAPRATGAAEPVSYQQLSPGKRSITEALFRGHAAGGDGNRQAWSRDRIADARQGGSGWRRMFKQLQSEGLIEQRDPGSLTSKHR